MEQFSRNRGPYPKMSLIIPENGSQQRFISWEKFFLVTNSKKICEKFDMKQLSDSQKMEEQKTTLGRVIGMNFFFLCAFGLPG